MHPEFEAHLPAEPHSQPVPASPPPPVTTSLDRALQSDADRRGTPPGRLTPKRFETALFAEATEGVNVPASSVREWPGKMPHSVAESSEAEAAVARGTTHPLDDPDLVRLCDGIRNQRQLGPGDSLSAGVLNYCDRLESFNVVGSTAQTPEDMVALFSAIRSPLVERFAWLIHAQGHVVHSGLYSIGGPSYCEVPVDAEELDQLAHLTKKFDDATFVMAHNHPTGNPAPSRADTVVYNRIAKHLQAEGVDVAGLILDHVKASVWRPEAGWCADVSWDGEDFKRPRGIDKIFGPEQVADLASQVYRSDNVSLLLQCDAHSHLLGVNAVSSVQNMTYFEHLKTNHFASRVFLVTNEQDAHLAKTRAMAYGNNVLEDIIAVNGDGSWKSLRRMADYIPRGEDKFPTARVLRDMH